LRLGIVKDMDNLRDLLAKRVPGEPMEIGVIKGYVQEKFDEPVGVIVQEHETIIIVRSAALAGALRSHLAKLAELCGTPQKRFILRIGPVGD